VSRWSRWTLACAAATQIACGRLGYDSLSRDEADGGPNVGVSMPDAMPAEPDAAVGPFDDATRIDELADLGAADDDPSLSGDLLEIYFKSDRGSPGDFDIWRALRDSADQPWQPPERVDEVSSDAYEATPELSFDGLVMFLASARAGGLGGSDLWMSTRPSRADPWSAPVHVPELSSESDEWAAVTGAGQTHVVFTRAVPGNSLDLFGASRASAAQPWGAPVPLLGMATEVYEADGHLDAEGLRLAFAGEIDESRDIYLADRPSPDADFAPPVRIDELSSPSRDEDPWVSPDGRLIVFSSDRTGDQELYWARR
jgi:WD40-like Beta Propeller Repeat